MSVVREATASDIEACAALAEARRAQYEPFEPIFWKRRPGSEAMSKAWFTHLLSQPEHVFLVAEWAGAPVGFLIASPVAPPPVYDAGRTAVIDDFCVEDAGMWPSVGQHLLREARTRLRARGIRQIVVISGEKDAEKKAFLESEKLSLASTWWTAPV
ncbi:MAG: GNAT family N-acetyltransferase [Alphaproteobacteria bacterium]|nr:GNAT family N-acetyltransferase [Alphaproteobacteria bacterium]MBL7099484.1 GNAT family N-acetyltransferase [Alphaproteobacteria bacterium]